MTLIAVGSAQDLPEGKPVVVEVEGRQIAIVKWRARFFAVRNICPHQTAALGGGWVEPEAVAGETFFEFALDETSPVMRCPWHGWRYRLSDGSCVVDEHLRVRAYDVVVRDGTVFLDLERRRRGPAENI